MPTNRRLSVILFLQLLSSFGCQLVVNVKNNGGDIYRENINANTTQDTVSLEFRKADGTLATQFIDGRNEIQIFKVVILPEEERGQTLIQTMCFVSRFAKSEFISSDAMSKLRQKNPSAVRHPEETRPNEILPMDLVLNVASSHVLSPHIATLCADATETTYMADNDLRQLSQILNRDYQSLQSVTHSAPLDGATSCQAQFDLSQPCLCHYDLCVGWYPCGLKYCRGKDSANRVVSYRCGIKTCSKCRNFEFFVRRKSLCIWDEPEFSFESEANAFPEINRVSLSSKSNSAPLPNTIAKQGLEQDNKLQGISNASATKTIVGGNNQPVVKMSEAVNKLQGQEIPASNKPNVLGKSSHLDDDEDGE